MTRIQIALTTDMRMFEPTVISMMSAVEGASRPVTVHFMGWELTARAREILDRAIACWPGTELVYHDLVQTSSKGLSHLQFDGRHSQVTKAVLHVPRLVGEGRVLYLDSDTLTCADVGPLFDLDMQGCLIAAARDYGYLVTWSEGLPDDQADPYDGTDRVMAPYPFQDYINTGIVLFDSDSMMAEPGLIDALEDPAGLRCDTRRMVSVVKGRMLHLHPSWNALCGVYHRFPAAHLAMVPNDPDYVHLPPRIVHHVGVDKPWHAFDLDELKVDLEGTREKLWRSLGLDARGHGIGCVFHELKDEVCVSEYQLWTAIYRHAHTRYVGMLNDCGAGQVPNATSAVNETPGPE